ncbi:MAG: hypothetical protein O3A91_11885, partial [Proteobacteria bacterium]|nr:hypothetical protein [Pseudomonadota bacterium]
MKRTLSKMLLATALLSAPAALDAQAQTDPRQALAEAEKAYADGMEVGNEAVRELIERDPGNTELAVAGLRSILGRSHASAEWTRYASERLIALQELGAVSWNQDVIFDIYHARFLSDLKAHRRLSAKLLHDELSTHYHGSHRFSGLS